MSFPMCMCVKSPQSYLTLCNPMDCSPPGSSVQGILQARILEWAVMPLSRASSRPRDWTWVSCFTIWAAREGPPPPPRPPPIHEGRGQILCPNCWWFVVLSLQEKVEMQRQRFRWEFEKYRGFLALEEQLQLRRLEEEERATLQKLRESKNRLVQQSRALKELAEELEERCQRPALGLLEVRLGAWEKKDGHTWDQQDRWQLSEIIP